jgi:hypothetical protein
MHLRIRCSARSVMVFRLGAGAVAEVVVPLCLAKAGFLCKTSGAGYSTLLTINTVKRLTRVDKLENLVAGRIHD